MPYVGNLNKTTAPKASNSGKTPLKALTGQIGQKPAAQSSGYKFSADKYNQYESDYQTWSTTGKNTPGFTSWSNQKDLDTWKSIRDGKVKAAKVGNDYYVLSNDDYKRYSKDYDVWQKTGNHSKGFETWSNNDAIEAFRYIRDDANGYGGLNNLKASLDDELTKAVAEKYRSQWGDKYYYDVTNPDDIAAMNAGQMPAYLRRKYKTRDPIDQWLMEQGLPYGTLFNDMYSEAWNDRNERNAKRQQTYESAFNDMAAYQNGMNDLKKAMVGGMSFEDALATGRFDALGDFYDSSFGKTKESDSAGDQYYKAKKTQLDPVYDRAYEAMLNNERPDDEFFDQYKESTWKSYLKQKQKWNESSLQDVFDYQAIQNAGALIQESIDKNKLVPVGKKAMKDAGYRANDEWTMFSPQVFTNKDGTQSIVLNPIREDGTVIPKADLEKIAKRRLGEAGIFGGVAGKDDQSAFIATFDTKKEAREYANSLSDAVTTYYGTNQEDFGTRLEEARTRAESEQQAEQSEKIDLNNRPMVSPEQMRSAGWDVEDDGYATVFSSGYSNEDETETVLLTPIMQDGSRILTPDELMNYSDKILSGGADDLGLVLGRFHGADSIEQSNAYAKQLHEDQEEYYSSEANRQEQSYYDRLREIDSRLEAIGAFSGRRGPSAKKKEERDALLKEREEVAAELEAYQQQVSADNLANDPEQQFYAQIKGIERKLKSPYTSKEEKESLKQELSAAQADLEAYQENKRAENWDAIYSELLNADLNNLDDLQKAQAVAVQTVDKYINSIEPSAELISADNVSFSIPTEKLYRIFTGEEGNDELTISSKRDRDLINYATDQEMQTLNGIVAAGQDPGEYLQALEDVCKMRRTMEESDQAKNIASAMPAENASLRSVGTSLLSALEFPVNAIGAAVGDYNAIDVVDGSRFSRMTETIRNVISDEIRERNSNHLLLSNVTIGDINAFLYGTGMSVIESIARLPMGYAGLAFAGGSAANQTLIDQLNSGASMRQAFAMGSIGGAVEIITEKIGLDNLFGIIEGRTPTTVKDLFKNVLKQAGAEGSEEALSEIAGIISEAFIRGDQSEFLQSIQQYKKNGYSDAAATGLAIANSIGQVLFATAGGALSGIVMGGAGTALNMSFTEGQVPGGLNTVRAYQEFGDLLDRAGLAPEQIIKLESDIQTVGYSDSINMTANNLIDMIRENPMSLTNPQTLDTMEQFSEFFAEEANKARSERASADTKNAQIAKDREAAATRLNNFFTKITQAQNEAAQALITGDTQAHEKAAAKCKEYIRHYQDVEIPAYESEMRVCDAKQEELDVKRDQQKQDHEIKAADLLTKTAEEIRQAVAEVEAGNQAQLAENEANGLIDEFVRLNAEYNEATQNNDPNAQETIRNEMNEWRQAYGDDVVGPLIESIVNGGNNGTEESNGSVSGGAEQVYADAVGAQANEVPSLRQGGEPGDIYQRIVEGGSGGNAGESGTVGGVQEAVRSGEKGTEGSGNAEASGEVRGKIHRWSGKQSRELREAISDVNQDIRAGAKLKDTDIKECDPDTLTEQTKENIRKAESYTGIDQSYSYDLDENAPVELDGITPRDKKSSFFRNMRGAVMEIFAKAHEDAHRVKAFRDAVHEVLMGFDADIRDGIFKTYLATYGIKLDNVSYDGAVRYLAGQADSFDFTVNNESRVVPTANDIAKLIEEIHCDIVGAYVLNMATDGSMEGWSRIGLDSDSAQFFDLSWVLNGQEREADGTLNAEAKASIVTPTSENNDGVFPGVTYVLVDTDQDIFDGVDESKYAYIAEHYIKDRFRGKIIGGDNLNAYVRGDTAREYAHPVKHYKPEVFNAKMKSAPDLPDIIDASTFVQHENDDGRHKGAVRGWDKYRTLFRVGDNLFEGEINIMLTSKGRLLYDVTGISDVTEKYRTIGSDGSGAFARTTSDGSINMIEQHPPAVNINSFDAAPEQGAFSLGENWAAETENQINPQSAPEQELQANGIETREDGSMDRKNETKFSIRFNSDYMDKADALNAKTDNVEDFVMDTARKQREKIADYMTKNREALNLPDDIEGNTTVGNAAYGLTQELSTVCVRSVMADEFVDAVGEALGRPLTVEEAVFASQEAASYVKNPQCIYCYVAMDRAAYRQFLLDYIHQRDDIIGQMVNGTEKDNLDDLYKQFLGGRKDTKQMKTRFNMWADAVRKMSELITPADLASESAMDAAIARNPELAQQIADAKRYAQSASWAKKRLGYRAYNNSILSWSDSKVKSLNKAFGMRMYSFSDYSPAFILENMQMITDAAVKGLKVLAYTKDLDFVKIFAGTGANINISVFGYMQNGIIAEDAMQGAPWVEAQELRSMYPNVGCTFVATNDALVEWALAQDWIDVVIPFHLVRTGETVAEMMNYLNYTRETSDRKTPEWRKGVDPKEIYPTVHNNNKEQYMRALEEAHLAPRFERFVDNPNYMKLVNETRRSAENTFPVQPVFNTAEAINSLNKMMKEGGYVQHVGGSIEDMRNIANETAEKINNGGVERFKDFQRRMNESNQQALNDQEEASQLSIRPPVGLTREQRSQMYQWDRERLNEQYRKMSSEQRAAVQKQREQMLARESKTRHRQNIVKNASDLRDWFTAPDVKKGKYIPDFLKDSIMSALGGIDLGSTQREGGRAVRNWRRSMQDLANNLTQYQLNQNGDSTDARFNGVYLDLPSGFVESFQDLAASIPEDGTNYLQDMDADQLEALDKALGILKGAVKKANDVIDSDRKQTIADVSEESIAEMSRRKTKHESDNKLIKGADTLFNADMLDPNSYARRLGNAGGSMIQGIIDGFIKGTTKVHEATDFVEQMEKDIGVTRRDTHRWSNTPITVTLESGETISMTEAQAMNLYALSNRPQALQHILNGGIELGYNRHTRNNQNRAYKLSFADMDNVFSKLSDKQKTYIDRLQTYLSRTASKWGNEVSQKLYETDLYGEEFYWPIKSAKSNLATQDPEKVRAMNAIINSGFTNALNKYAKNPIMLDDATQVFTDHIAQMSNYNGMAIPIANAMKWFNYQRRGIDGSVDYNKSVKRAVVNALGRNGASYFINLIKDVNGLSEGGTGTALPSVLVSNAKRAAVAAKLRVMVQQPTAIARAMAMVNPKYFVGISNAKLPSVVKEMQDAAPIAWWKSQGNFDIGTGKSMRDILFGDGNAYDQTMNAMMAPAGWADDFGWAVIWNAVKREQRARNKDLSEKDLMAKVVRRFTDVINETQVIDTVVHRSQIMRSKDNAVKQGTAFMSEPMKTLNMLRNAAFDVQMGEPGAKGRLAKSAAAVAGSWALNAAVLALHDSLRDRDEDEDFWELFKEKWLKEFTDNANPINSIPYLKDIAALVKGDDVDRMDMTGLGDLITSIQRISKAIQEGDSNYTTYGLTRGLLTSIGNVLGTPVNGLISTAETITNGIKPGLIQKKKSKGWQKAETLIEEGIDKNAARGLMKTFNSDNTATKAFSILTYDADNDGVPDFDEDEQNAIAIALGLSYDPERDGSLQDYAVNAAEKYLKQKQKIMDDEDSTDEEYEKASESYDKYSSLFDDYFDFLGL